VSDGDEQSGSGDEETAAAVGDRLARKFGEPAEFDPTERFGDPERDAPAATAPDNPADRLPDPSEVDGEIQSAFWRAVLWTNVALAGLVVGPTYAVFGDGTQLGVAATVVGALAAVRVYQTVRAFQRRDEDDSDAGADESADGEPDAGAESDTDEDSTDAAAAP
jgi:hypothetical protein